MLNTSGLVSQMLTKPTEYRQPGEIRQDQVPHTFNNRLHHPPQNNITVTQYDNGEANVFAPYIVVNKKKDGETYQPYVMTNPYDPYYYNYINNLA